MRCLQFTLTCIDQNSTLLPRIRVWTVFSSNVAVEALTSAKDRRLGKHLPHQLPNLVSAHFLTTKSLEIFGICIHCLE